MVRTVYLRRRRHTTNLRRQDHGSAERRSSHGVSRVSGASCAGCSARTVRSGIRNAISRVACAVSGSDPRVHGSTTRHEHPRVDFSVGARVWSRGRPARRLLRNDRSGASAHRIRKFGISGAERARRRGTVRRGLSGTRKRWNAAGGHPRFGGGMRIGRRCPAAHGNRPLAPRDARSRKPSAPSGTGARPANRPLIHPDDQAPKSRRSTAAMSRPASTASASRSSSPSMCAVHEVAAVTPVRRESSQAPRSAASWNAPWR
jgi:hypothetical protein